MKKLFKTLIILLCIFGLSESMAQDHEHKNNWNQEHQTKNVFSKKDFGLVIGLNSFEKAYDMPELDTWNSRYVALQWRTNHKLLTGRQMDVALGTGLEIGWNNFMMRYDEQYFETNGISDFELLDYPLQKSKLVVNTLSLPVMLQFGFKESNFRFGIGGFGGIRINSYQKFVENGDKFREKGEYNIRRFNYGLLAEAGWSDFRLFAKYDMQPLFNHNNPINANVLSFGIRL